MQLKANVALVCVHIIKFFFTSTAEPETTEKRNYTVHLYGEYQPYPNGIYCLGGKTTP
jgi:hypothetical protein